MSATAVPPLTAAISQESSRALLGIAVLLCLLATLGGGWRASGGSWAVIETPSMGRAAPVGTLILTRAAELAELRVGDIITYRPRNEAHSIYTHRVVARYPDGTLQVQGDINGSPDPFPVGQDDLIGKVVARGIGLGYLVRALPTLLLAAVVLTIGSAVYVPTRWRSSVRILGCCLLFGTASLILRPFVHPILIAVVTTESGHQASVVSGGLLPTRVSGLPGSHVDLMPGQTGVVEVAAQQDGGPLMVTGTSHLEGWWLVGAIGVCTLPMLWCLLVGLAPVEEQEV